MKIIYKKESNQMVPVTSLVNEELDKWVARAMDQEVLGKALVYYDPESGSLTVDIDQKEYQGTFMSTHMHYMYSNCSCELYDTLDKEMSERFEEDGLEREVKEKVLGHNVFCLQPVLEYSTNEHLLSFMMTKYNLGVSPLVLSPTEVVWVAHVNHAENKNDKFFLIKGNTPSEAVSRAIVYSKYGEEVPGD